MKKILSTLLLFALFITCITGCNKQENTATLIAKDLDSNLNKLTVTVNKLDTIDNKYLANPDIYSSFATQEQDDKYFKLATAEPMQVETISQNSTTDIVKQMLIDKITDRLLGQNTISNTGNGLSCQKYCDTNGNCYYKDCNGNCYCYGTNGECYSCNYIPSSCSYCGQTKLYGCPNASAITTENGSLVASQISTTEENILEDQKPSTEHSVITPNIRMYYFTQDSFSPVKLRYNPRYISQYSETNINEQIDSYLFKVQKLYAMSEDSIEANTILKNCKQEIIDCIKEIRELNNCIINGTCEPNIQQLQALNSYIEDIKTTTKRLKKCNGELTKELSNISESNNDSVINSVDVMNSNYMRLLNHIDTRITYHKSAIATLEQIKYLLDTAINNNEITDEELENILSELTQNPIEENTETTNDIVNSEQTEIVNDNLLDDNSTENDTIDEIPQDETSDETVDNSTTEYNSEDSYQYNETEQDNLDDVSNVDNTNEQEQNFTDESQVNDQTSNNDNIESSENNENIDTTADTNIEDNRTGNVDTFNNTPWSNVDTYRSDNSNTENTQIENDDTETNNEIIDNNNIVDDNNTEIIDENTTFSDNNSNIDDTNTMENNSVVNNENDEIINNPSIVNNNGVNSGLYHNSVITQNNLDTNNGYGGYYYTADGKIKNNGLNNDNEIGNNGNTVETNLNRNSNVNTYGYNTLLDIINQGTVNNGINTL